MAENDINDNMILMEHANEEAYLKFISDSCLNWVQKHPTFLQLAERRQHLFGEEDTVQPVVLDGSALYGRVRHPLEQKDESVHGPANTAQHNMSETNRTMTMSLPTPIMICSQHHLHFAIQRIVTNSLNMLLDLFTK